MVAALGMILAGAVLAPATPVVEAEEDLYIYVGANNGAGPMWCFGSTCVARVGDKTFASGLETIEGAKPLNNTRWMLFVCDANGWRRVLKDDEHRTREPSPLVGLPDGRLLLSVNPTLTEPDTYNGPAQPQVLEFSAQAPGQAPTTLLPVWDGQPEFTEHSYRSFAADGPNGEMILLQNIGYTHAEWAFRDRDGKWSAAGKLVWPYGAEYEQPEPIRVCYPNVALKDRAVYFCGVSDIVEPNLKWRARKKEITGQEWDYDFRRLFFTWCPDITQGKFAEWVEVASREKTCGWISPCDLYVAPDGDVHVMWTERALDERLREEFYPGERQRHSLEYAVIRDRTVVLRKTLAEAGEGLGGEVPGQARFQVLPDGRLFVFRYVSGTGADGNAVSGNRLAEILPGGGMSESVVVPLQHPFSSFFTATPRGGSPPSAILELLGESPGESGTIRYARVRIE